MPLSTLYLTAGSYILSTDGFALLADPMKWAAVGDPIGPDHELANVAGTTYKAKKQGPLDIVDELEVYGDNDYGGTPHADEVSGVLDNIATLQANLLAINVGLVTVTLTFPDASTLSSTKVEFKAITPRVENPVGTLAICDVVARVHDGLLS